MLLIWFLLVAAMLAAYVVLDGFDLGVGVLHLFVARNDEERRLLVRTIGSVWDGNEVWLLAGGGTLYFAFPLLYASGFSGFYLPLMIVLWLLILRGIGIELSGHVDSPVWRGICNGCFGIGSTLLTVFYGAALGNVIRGVPLQPDRYFFLPLWTDFNVGATPGILDWYTIIAGLVALAALTLHGANYAALKTEGELNIRVKGLASALWLALVALTAISLVATLLIRPDMLDNYKRFPALFLIPAAVAAALMGTRVMARRGDERGAFVCSCAYLAFMLVGAAAALYPNLLTSTTDPALNVTVYNAHSGDYALTVGLVWWVIGIALATSYFIFVYRMFRGKMSAAVEEHEGY